MARVVQRRTSPPYLTVVFVFLFLLATTFAVLFYLNADKAKKANAESRDLLGKLISTSEQNDGAIQRLMRNAAESRPRVTVVGQLTQQVDQLTKKISGDPDTGAAGLEGQLAAAVKERDDALKQAKNLTARLTLTQGELEKKQNQLAQLIADDKASRDQLRGQFAELDAKFRQREAEHQKQLADAEEQWKNIRATLDAGMAERTQQLEQLRVQLQQAQAEVKRLREIIGQGDEDDKLAIPLPDGKIMEVVQENGFCYINIGKDQNVRPGFNFAVYPSTGIPQDGADKGAIVVVNVKPNISGCRIVRSDKADPVMAGDLIGNVAFDPTRTYTFVVAGHFDLRGGGEPSALGNQEVKTLIREHGSTVVDELSLQTDYLVLGEPPVRPRTPRPEDPPEVQAVYSEQKKIYDRYVSIKAQAQDLNVPILSTNRFLSFIGYSPGGLGR